MPHISYRNRLLLKKLLRYALILLAVALVAAVVVLIYVEPYIVYERDGAHLELSKKYEATTPSEAPTPRPTVENPQIVYDSGEGLTQSIADLGGYYITTSMLQDPSAVLEAVQALNEPCAVYMELKSVWGNFYYSTSLTGRPLANVDIDTVNALISYLNDNGFYMIASVPAFPDQAYALENTSCGLPLSNGALWMDENGTYWLDPGNETVISYLLQIARDLASLGFNEIVFSEFRFPSSNSIAYSSAKTTSQLLSDTASELAGFFTGSKLTISFRTNLLDFVGASSAGRLYISDVDGSRVELYAQAYADGPKEVVFLSSSRDTRFENQAVLRPLLTSQ